MSHALIDGGRAHMLNPSGGAYVNDTGSDTRVIDGTPLTLGVLLLGAGALLFALKQSGFRFVIGVGGS